MCETDESSGVCPTLVALVLGFIGAAVWAYSMVERYSGGF